MSRAILPNRLDTSVSDAPTIEQAHHLMAQLQIGNADLYRNAVELFGWCVREVQEGRRIASVDHAGQPVREVAMPIMNPARVSRYIVVSGEGAQQIAHLLDNPPAPTEALRALMARTRQMQRLEEQASAPERSASVL